MSLGIGVYTNRALKNPSFQHGIYAEGVEQQSPGSRSAPWESERRNVSSLASDSGGCAARIRGERTGACCGNPGWRLVRHTLTNLTLGFGVQPFQGNVAIVDGNAMRKLV